MQRNIGIRIDWVAESCALLASLADEFRKTLPFEGFTIGAGIHLEPKTVALLMTLRAGGANVVVSGNLGSTQPECVTFLRSRGIAVHAAKTRDATRHAESLRKVLAERPQILLDNGGDLFAVIGGSRDPTLKNTRSVGAVQDMSMSLIRHI